MNYDMVSITEYLKVLGDLYPYGKSDIHRVYLGFIDGVITADEADELSLSIK